MLGIAPHLGGKGVRVRSCRQLKSALEAAYAGASKFQLIKVMFRTVWRGLSGRLRVWRKTRNNRLTRAV